MSSSMRDAVVTNAPAVTTPGNWAADPRALRPWAGSIVLLLGACVAFLWGLGARPFDVADVVRYAQMAFEMRHDHSLVPTLGGLPYFGATPLAAWATLAVASWSGAVTPGAARLLSALATVATVALVAGFAWRRVGPRAGLFAGAAFALSPLTIAAGRTSRIDVTLALGVTLAVVALFLAVRTRPEQRTRRLAWGAVAGVGVALGVAAKGPAAGILIAAALLPWMVWERRLIPGLVPSSVALFVAALLTATWFVPYTYLLGVEGTREFLDQFLMKETLAKVADGYGKAEPFWSYAAQFLPKLAPWSVPALCAVVRVVRRPSAASAVERLAVSWLIVPVVLLSISEGKHIRYLVPMVPAVALLAAVELRHWVAAAGPRVRRLSAGAGVALALVAASLALGLAGWTIHNDGWAPARGLPPLAVASVAVLAAVCIRRRATAIAAGALYLAACGCVALHYGVLLALPSASERAECARLAAEIRAAPLPDGDLVLVSTGPGGRPNARGIEAQELGLFLGRWVGTAPRDRLPPALPLLSRRPIEGRPVLRTVHVAQGNDRPARPWLLLGPEGGSPTEAARVTAPRR